MASGEVLISELDTKELNSTTLFELENTTGGEPDSGKTSATALGNYLNGVGTSPLEYASLNTNSKKIIGAINELKSAILSQYPTNEASGAIANFNTQLALPIVAGKFDIDYLANGYTGMVIQRTKKNLISINDETIESASYVLNNIDTALPAGTYLLSFVFSGTSSSSSLRVDDSSGTAIYTTTKTINAGLNEFLFTINSPSSKVKLFSNAIGSYTNFQIEKGSSYTGYEEYLGYIYSITFGTTIYGGYFDSVSGILTSTKTSDGTDLPSPVEYQLTPEEITALVGTNNIWCDTGDCEVSYKQDIQGYIDEKIASVQALALNS